MASKSTVSSIEEKEKVEKNKNKDFNKAIFLGNRIDHLIYTIYQNNKKFIDLNDAQQKFEFLFCKKYSEGWHVDKNRPYGINDDYDIVLYPDNLRARTENIDELKIFIRHKNCENILKGHDIPYYGSIDINTLREEEYFEIDVKENNDETGFKYKLTDCKDNHLSYGVDEDENKEVSKLKNCLNNKYTSSELKDFIERFDLGINNSEVVLLNKAKSIFLTGDHVNDTELICLGAETKLILSEKFFDEFKNRIENGEKSNNKIYVLPDSQAFKDVLNFIFGTRIVPFESLYFIDKKIVEAYNIKDHISDNIEGQKVPTLCIYYFKMNPNLKPDELKNKLVELQDKLDKLIEIGDTSKCILAFVEFLSAISSDGKDFKYELSYYENGTQMIKATVKNLRIRIQVKAIKEFLRKNGVTDDIRVGIGLRIGKTIKTINGANESIDINNLEDSSYLEIECLGNQCTLCFIASIFDGNMRIIQKITKIAPELKQIGDNLYFCAISEEFSEEKQHKIENQYRIKVDKVDKMEDIQESSKVENHQSSKVENQTGLNPKPRQEEIRDSRNWSK